MDDSFARSIHSCWGVALLNRTYASFCINRSPPERSRSPCSVPTPGGIGLHLRCHVLVLRYLLLNSQLLIVLILFLPSDVGDACLLVFIQIENVSFYGGAFHLVRWQ